MQWAALKIELTSSALAASTSSANSKPSISASSSSASSKKVSKNWLKSKPELILPPAKTDCYTQQPRPFTARSKVHCLYCRQSPAHPPHRSEEHTSELQSRGHIVCRLLLEK